MDQLSLLCEYWTGSGSENRLPKFLIERLSERLFYLSNKIPYEFQRSTRSLDDLSK